MSSHDYVEWTGSEQCLMNLLIWWGTRQPFVHTETCRGKDTNMLHCCEGKPIPNNKAYRIISDTAVYPDLIKFNFVTPDGTETAVDVGDRIYYLGEGDFELVKHG